MTTTILFAAPEDAWDAYRAPLTEALDATGIDYRLARDIPAEEVDYVVYAPSSGLTDFTPFPRLKAVLSLWAGVEKIVGNPKLTVPLARMVDDEGLTQGMVEYVTGHVLRHHLGMDAHIVNPAHEWVNKAPPLARERPVTVLGLGMLGRACARQLAQIGFPVTGWSRTPREIEGLRCLSGSEGLSEALAGAQIVVTLLPFTPQTENTLGATELAQLAEGAWHRQSGRGQLIDDGPCWRRWTAAIWATPRSMYSGSSRCRRTIRSGITPRSPSRRISPPRRARTRPRGSLPRTCGAASRASPCCILWTGTRDTDKARRI